MINKILPAVFVVLLVILLGEAGYLVYFQNPSIKSGSNSKKVSTLPISLTPKIESPWLQKINRILTINESRPGTKFYFQTEVEGKINKIGYNKDYESYEIELVNDKNEKVISFLIEEKNLKNISVFLADNKPADFLDLKVGDSLQWKTKENIRDSDDVESVILLKNR